MKEKLLVFLRIAQIIVDANVFTGAKYPDK